MTNPELLRVLLILASIERRRLWEKVNRSGHSEAELKDWSTLDDALWPFEDLIKALEDE